MLKKIILKFRSSFSQGGQDLWVATEVFNEKKGGIFVDAGAFDGINFSNTYLLEKRYNWKGLCIEPNPSAFRRLQKHRRVICESVLLSDACGKKKFYLKEMASSVQKIKNSKSFLLPSCPLSMVLKKHNFPKVIDYLSMDIEGSEEKVLKNFPFKKYMFRCATIERPTNRVKKILKKYGYFLIKEVKGLDAFFVHKKFFKEYITNMFAFYEKKSYRVP